jgi:hypothetical protein
MFGDNQANITKIFPHHTSRNTGLIALAYHCVGGMIAARILGRLQEISNRLEKH